MTQNAEMEASTVEAYHEYTALSCFTAFQKQLAQFDKLCPWILKNSTNRKKKNDKSETLRPVGKKCKIPRCKTHSKLTLASEVSRSHQNFPILKFFKIPFYTLQPQEKSTQNISWDLFITILGDLQNNPTREVVLPYVAFRMSVSPNMICFLPLWLWNRV